MIWALIGVGALACGSAETDTQTPPVQAEVDVAAVAPPSETAPAPEPVVETRAGRLRGSYEAGVFQFKGVPYGASTSGANRFRPPQPAAAWSGERDATRFGDICPQTGVVATGRPNIPPFGAMPRIDMSEDCLVLNVYTPGLDGKARPVMVWFHGRGFREGAGSEPMYEGTPLAKSGDVVVVTVNHRLNVFGYLHLADLGGEAYAGSGVAGMLDGVQALEWVRDNVRAFGGDPQRVTIFGESGGGAKVSTLLGMPAARGLFHRAVIQSGPGIRAVEPADATASAKALLEQLGLGTDELAKLRELPVEKILEAMNAVAEADPRQFRPVVDGTYLPAHPYDPVAAPSAAGVPLLIGANKDEAALFLLGDPKRGKLTGAELDQRLEKVLGADKDAVLGIYRGTRPTASPWDLFVAIGTERTRLASITLAERHGAAPNSPVFMYSFDWETNAAGGLLKAAHGLEIPFVFDHPERFGFTGDRPGRRELARAVSAAWVAFAKTGDPSHEGIPRWEPYTPETRATMVFDDEIALVRDLRREERLAWEGIEPVRLP